MNLKSGEAGFDKLFKRNGVHRVYSEASSLGKAFAKSYKKEFAEYLKAEGYVTQQVFNCDEIGLF